MLDEAGTFGSLKIVELEELAVNELTSEEILKLYQWYLILLGVVSTIAHAQDMPGRHRARGRRTILLAIGDLNERVILALGVINWT